MQGHIGNVTKEKEILRKKMLRIKNTVTEMKNVFGRLIGRLDIAKERISELKDVSIETSKTDKQREQRLKNRISKNCGTSIQGLTYV